MLQCNRTIYNQFECDSTCNLCGDADETFTHFLLECKAPQECRQPIVAAIESTCASLCVDLGSCTLGVELVKLVIDCCSVLTVHPEVKVAQLMDHKLRPMLNFKQSNFTVHDCHALHGCKSKRPQVKTPPSQNVPELVKTSPSTKKRLVKTSP